MGMFPAYARFTPLTREYDGVITSIGLNLFTPLTREYEACAKELAARLGSSPLTRGILVPGILKSADIRFIPLTRGILLHAVEISRSWVHPLTREYLMLSVINRRKQVHPLTREYSHYIALLSLSGSPAHAGIQMRL